MNNERRKGSLILFVPIVLLLVAVFLLIMSFNEGIAGSSTKVNNIVTNEITNTIVKYEELTVDDIDEAVQVAVKKVENAVIGVTSKAVSKMGNQEVETNYSIGSGVIYKVEEVKDKSGKLINYLYYLITNRHVVTLDSSDTDIDELNLYTYIGEDDVELQATLIGYDSKVDIALLTFEYSKYIDPVEVADSDALNKGQLAIAIGNPDGYDYYGSVTFGVISGPTRYVSTDTDGDGTNDFSAEYIQHDVAINPGNSGGGLFTLDGKLIGINTLKLVDDTIDNMGFAIPSNVALTIVEDYLEKGIAIERPRLGVMGYEIRSLTSGQIASTDQIISIPNIYGGETPYGLYVAEVVEGSTIAETDITTHDIILSINGIKATRTYVVNSKLNSLEDGFTVGETVVIEYYDRSSGTIKTTNVVLKK